PRRAAEGPLRPPPAFLAFGGRCRLRVAKEVDVHRLGRALANDAEVPCDLLRAQHRTWQPAEAAGFRHGNGELGRARPRHRREHDWKLDANELAETGRWWHGDLYNLEPDIDGRLNCRAACWPRPRCGGRPAATPMLRPRLQAPPPGAASSGRSGPHLRRSARYRAEADWRLPRSLPARLPPNR